MAKGRKGTIPADVADAYLGGGTAAKVEDSPRRGAVERVKEPGEGRVSFATQLPERVVERVRDAAYWDRQTVAEIVERALEREVSRMEKERGTAYERRPGRLRAGRPVKR